MDSIDIVEYFPSDGLHLPIRQPHNGIFSDEEEGHASDHPCSTHTIYICDLLLSQDTIDTNVLQRARRYGAMKIEVQCAFAAPLGLKRLRDIVQAIGGFSEISHDEMYNRKELLEFKIWIDSLSEESCSGLLSLLLTLSKDAPKLMRFTFGSRSLPSQLCSDEIISHLENTNVQLLQLTGPWLNDRVCKEIARSIGSPNAFVMLRELSICDSSITHIGLYCLLSVHGLPSLVIESAPCLGDQGIVDLEERSRMFATCSISSIHLVDCGIGLKGGIALSQMLVRQGLLSMIQHLDLRHNHRDLPMSYDAIAEALQDNEQLRTFSSTARGPSFIQIRCILSRNCDLYRMRQRESLFSGTRDIQSPLRLLRISPHFDANVLQTVIVMADVAPLRGRSPKTECGLSKKRICLPSDDSLKRNRRVHNNV